MNKYIIKNCPALRWDRKKFKICHERNACIKCKDIPDCPFKRIVNKCRIEIEDTKDLIGNNPFSDGIHHLANWILDLLEIEEAE